MRRSKRRRVSRNDDIPEDAPFVYDQKNLQIELLRIMDVRIICRVFKRSWSASVTREWRNSDTEDQIKTIIEGCKERQKNNQHPLRKCVKKIPAATIKRVYTEFVDPSTTKLTRDICVWEIIYKFLGETSPLDSRNNEKGNLADVKNLKELIRFTKLCNITIPKEVLDQVFEYVEQNYSTLVKIGSVCSHFYLTLLSNWRGVRIDKMNIYKISLLVLESATTVSFLGRKNEASKDLLVGDWEYILPKLKRIQTLKWDRGQFKNLIRSVRKYRQKCESENNNLSNYHFKNITQVEFVSKYKYIFNNRYDLKWSEQLFPSVDTITSVGEVKNRPNLKSKKIRNIEFRNLPCYTFKFTEHTVSGLTNLRKISTGLRFRYKSDDDVGKLYRRLDSIFTNPRTYLDRIEELEIRLWCTDQFRTPRKLSFSQFGNYKSIKKLVIRNNMGQKRNALSLGLMSDDPSNWYSPVDLYSTTTTSINSPYQFHEVHIFSVSNSDLCNISENSKYFRKVRSYNFNFEDIVETKFLEVTRSPNLKVFRAELPLSSRSRNYGHLFSPTFRSYTSVQNTYELYCEQVVGTIDDFFKFVGVGISRFETFDLKILFPSFWDLKNLNRNEESFRMIYDREWNRFRIQMEFKEDCGNCSYDEETCFDLVRMKNVLMTDERPAALFFCVFVNRIIFGGENKLNIGVIETSFGCSVRLTGEEENIRRKGLDFLKKVAEKKCVKDVFLFDEVCGTFGRR